VNGGLPNLGRGIINGTFYCRDREKPVEQSTKDEAVNLVLILSGKMDSAWFRKQQEKLHGFCKKGSFDR